MTADMILWIMIELFQEKETFLKGFSGYALSRKKKRQRYIAFVCLFVLLIDLSKIDLYSTH